MLYIFEHFRLHIYVSNVLSALNLYRYEYIELGATQKSDGGIFECIPYIIYLFRLLLYIGMEFF